MHETGWNSRCGGKLVLAMITWAVAVGCQQLSHPFGGPEPAYKSQYGLTPQQKIDRLATLASQLGGQTAQQQLQMSRDLTAALSEEADPLVRRALIRALGAITVPQAEATLQAALRDPSTLVRQAACEAWGRRQGPAAVQALAEVLKADEEVDVRLAASRALGQIGSPAATRVLGTALDANDPAIQLVAMQALRNATGRNLGDDVNQWYRYLAQQPAATMPSGPVIQQATALVPAQAAPLGR